MAFTSDANSVAVVPAFGEGEGTVDVRDLSSGRLLYSRSVTTSGHARFREGGNPVAPDKDKPALGPQVEALFHALRIDGQTVPVEVERRDPGPAVASRFGGPTVEA
ncbi:hypothetical protein [Streptomyces sp. NPDC002722]|uniref:hypothetical protein n=1 Tax=unclassified Streptomyces TaxID=2593676 RepID=UPI00331A9388